MKKIISVSLVVLILAGCAGGPRYGGNVRYGDEKGVEQVTNEFGSTDVQMIAEDLSRKMLQSPAIANSRDVVTVVLNPVRNKTSEYIDTAIVTKKIKNVLTNSGKVRFVVNQDTMQNQVDQLRLQNQSGLYDSRKTAKVGKMSGAQYSVNGSISSIVKRGNDVKDVWYTFQLELIEIQTGETVWSDDKDIRKTSGR